MRNKLIVLAVLTFSFIASKAVEPLKLNLEQDKTYSIQSTSENLIKNNMNGMEMEVTNKSFNKMSFTVLSKEQTSMLVKVTFDSMINEISMPGRNIYTSSVKPGNAKNPEEFMNTALYNLSKNALEVKMGYNGKIIEIINAKPVIAEIMKSLDSLPQATQMQMRPMLEMSLNESSIKSMIETVTYYLPENNETDSWTNKINISAQGMTLMINSKQKVKNRTADATVIVGEATIEPVGSSNFDMRGMGNGEMTVENATGWIIKGKGKQRMKGSMTMNGMTIPIEIESKSELKRLN